MNYFLVKKNSKNIEPHLWRNKNLQLMKTKFFDIVQSYIQQPNV